MPCLSSAGHIFAARAAEKENNEVKKVINGKRYDTTTAKMVARRRHGIPGGLDYLCEEIYRKSTGEFFLHGEGGAGSSYSQPLGDNSWSGGEKIVPLSYADAQEWVENYCSGGQYEEIFGPVNEDEEKRTVALRLTPAAVAKLKNAAAQQGKSLSDVVESLIQAL